MPNPLPGDGDLVATQGQVLPLGVIYRANSTSSSTVAAPPPSWGQPPPVLQDDIFTITEPDPDGVE